MCVANKDASTWFIVNSPLFGYDDDWNVRDEEHPRGTEEAAPEGGAGVKT
jgi:hypothetical protein